MKNPLRADAQANHDRLLTVAAEAFARDGSEASLKAIAAEAGVGIGTLYRRFPTREDLVEATYRNETMRLAGSAATLLGQLAPDAALSQWAERFVDYMLTKRGMADALPAILAAHEGLRLESRDALAGAVHQLLDAGVAAGVFDPQIDTNDLLMALGGIILISNHEDERELASRLIAMLMDGVLARTPHGAGDAPSRP